VSQELKRSLFSLIIKEFDTRGPSIGVRVWTSKCGPLEDIEHKTLRSVEGREYGHATTFLKRRIDRKPFFKERMLTLLRRILAVLRLLPEGGGGVFSICATHPQTLFHSNSMAEHCSPCSVYGLVFFSRYRFLPNRTAAVSFLLGNHNAFLRGSVRRLPIGQSLAFDQTRKLFHTFAVGVASGVPIGKQTRWRISEGCSRLM